MTVGCLGDIVFTVSENEVKTFNNAKWSGSASFGTHQRHNGSSLVEFVGSDADTFSLNIQLTAFLGVNVMEEIDKIIEAEQQGKILNLVIGKRSYGRYRWVIKKHTVTMKYFGKNNEPTVADVSLSLTEYIKE
ncbi:MAG: phage tail protein [Oscillospiraceae bacterium]|nr:phage tail protein [Oscillospiraceae bacterium]MCH5207533.1 phage tail protein [Oscillospiraceae bacterium]